MGLWERYEQKSDVGKMLYYIFVLYCLTANSKKEDQEPFSGKQMGEGTSIAPLPPSIYTKLDRWSCNKFK